MIDGASHTEAINLRHHLRAPSQQDRPETVTEAEKATIILRAADQDWDARNVSPDWIAKELRRARRAHGVPVGGVCPTCGQVKR